MKPSDRPDRTSVRIEPGRFAVLVCALAAVLMARPLAAAEDLAGAVDPLEITRYPFSWIVGYERDDRPLPREYALGRVDKTRRDVRVEHEVRVSATREWATYEMPGGTQPADVIDHYLEALSAEALFTCRGRDCGRSNLWANEIFKRAILYGPDRNQFYFAGQYRDHLIALYVIERGNKRVYAHLEVLNPESQVALRHNAQIFERLAGEGAATLDGVVPGRMGNLGEAELAMLTELVPRLSVFAGQTVFVVCHLYGSDPGTLLLERSTRCADQAAAALRSAEGPELVPFGAGPLLPRVGTSSRIELILPHRLSH